MRIVSQMQCFVLFLWAVCKPKMMQSNIKSSWLSWNRWLSTRSVLLVFSSSLGRPLFGRPIGLSIGCSLHLSLICVGQRVDAGQRWGCSLWVHLLRQVSMTSPSRTLKGSRWNTIFIVLMVKMLFAGGPCCVQGKGLRGGQRGQQVSTRVHRRTPQPDLLSRSTRVHQS